MSAGAEVLTKEQPLLIHCRQRQTEEMVGTGVWMGVPRQEPDCDTGSLCAFKHQQTPLVFQGMTEIHPGENEVCAQPDAVSTTVLFWSVNRAQKPPTYVLSEEHNFVFLLIRARTYLLLTAFLCRVGNVDYGQGNAQGI